MKYAWYYIPWLQSLICKYALSERMILISFENCSSPLILIGKANIENVNIACLSTSLWLLKMSTVSRCHHHSDNWNCQHIVLVVTINITTGIINITRISLIIDIINIATLIDIENVNISRMSIEFRRVMHFCFWPEGIHHAGNLPPKNNCVINCIQESFCQRLNQQLRSRFISRKVLSFHIKKYQSASKEELCVSSLHSRKGFLRDQL